MVNNRKQVNTSLVNSGWLVDVWT